MDEIEELYSLIKPVAELIVLCQQTRVPAGQAALIALATLKLTTLNVNKPLNIITPARKLAQGGTAGVGGGERKTTSAPRGPEELTSVASQARVQLEQAVHSRWFRKRYHSPETQATDYVFDMQMALHPTTAALEYVDSLASTPEYAATVKTAITDKIVALAVELKQRDEEREGGEGAADSQGAPAAKRARPTPPGTVHPVFARSGNKQEEATTAACVSLGLFTKGGGAVQGPTLEERVRAELKTLQSVQAGSLAGEMAPKLVLQWWKRWESSYPLLARVARVVFGAPASAAVLERDFSDAGRMMTSSRSSTDTKYVEMVLFLHGNLDLIPEDIPELPAEGPNSVQTKIPGRLADPNPELEELS
ncbi:unnamed protein product, partial [Ectocarpus fasciculatus]